MNMLERVSHTDGSSFPSQLETYIFLLYSRFSILGTSLVVWRLRLHTPNVGGRESGQGMRSHVPQLSLGAAK